jgi:hypothetical protein
VFVLGGPEGCMASTTATISKTTIKSFNPFVEQGKVLLVSMMTCIYNPLQRQDEDHQIHVFTK